LRYITADKSGPPGDENPHVSAIPLLLAWLQV